MLIFLYFFSQALQRVTPLEFLFRESVVRLLCLQVKLIVARQAATLFELVKVIFLLLI